MPIRTPATAPIGPPAIKPATAHVAGKAAVLKCRAYNTKVRSDN